MWSRHRQEVGRWLRAARRVLGVLAVLLLGAVALAALLLPPAARADGGGVPPVRAADGDVAAPPPGPRDGRLVPDALAALGSGLWAGPPPPALPARTPASPVRCAAAANGFSGRVNINQASERELDLLPGIGPAKAQRIVAWRASHGPFRRIKDLRRVKGFGRKTVLKLFPYLALDGPTTATVARAR
jgi:competence ComEA-like helix-hairpin-helix protein